MRGTVFRIIDGNVGQGITPACAGNRSGVTKLTITTPDHPRVCGEQFNLVCESLAWRGSPPRVRGTADSGADIDSHLGITPACAGNSYYLFI